MSTVEDPHHVAVGAPLEFLEYPSTVVLQPTPLCNMRCTYCYLPDVSDRHRMDVNLVQDIATDLETRPKGHRTEVRWHAGEPLTIGVDYLGQLMAPLEDLRVDGRVTHSLQTNATLVNDRWCELFHRYDVDVGVSIDGPAWANRRRRTLSGAETFDRTMRGIACLRKHSLSFSIIAVVSLDDMPRIIERPAEYLDFFRSTGAKMIGFNVEETEGHHVTGVAPGIVESFWHALFDAWVAGGGQPKVRDFIGVLEFARQSLAGQRRLRPIDLLPTVTWNGDVTVLSPELAGYRDANYGDFRIGSLRESSLSEVLSRAETTGYVREFQEGAEHCRATCRYFAYCRAGQASNRYFEHGDFVTAETTFCQRTRQILFDVVVGYADEIPRK
jgi:uncharacterized protein